MSECPLDMETVWANFGAALHRYVRARVDNSADAEDIVHDVFLKLQARQGQLREHERLGGWLFRIANNAISDHYRGKRPAPLESDNLPTPGCESNEPPAVEQELAACIRPFLATLDPHYREAIQMVDLEGMTHAEAARLAGISVSGMKSRVQRGRSQLRGAIEACCHIDTDVRGGVVDYTPRTPCGCDE